MQWIADARAVRPYLSRGNAQQVTVKSVKSVDNYVSTYHEYLRVLRSTDYEQRSHPDGSLLSVVYSLLTLFYQQMLLIKQNIPRDTCNTWRQ